MSISSLSDSPTPRDESPPINPSPVPPISLPLSALPLSAQRALNPSPSPTGVLMPVDPSIANMQGAKGKEKEGTMSGKTASEGVDFAYEYVQVSQRRTGRQNITYEMTMRQQPVQARMCGVGEKSDRRPVDPTPIIQLVVIERNGEEVSAAGDSSELGKRKSLRRPDSGQSGMSFMQNPYYFLFACLVGGDEQDDELHLIDDGKTRFLTGTPVSSLYHLKDLDNSDAAFFVFPDLGVRKEGRYKLKLTLFEIVEQEVFYCTTMYTSTFSVFSAKKFPGMQRATDLSKTFAEQGLKIRVRKDPRRRTKTKRNSDANESEEDTFELPKRARTQSMSHQPAYPPPGRYAHSGPPPNGYYYVQPGYPPGQIMPPPPPPVSYDRYPVAFPTWGRPVVHPNPEPSRHHHSVSAPGPHPEQGDLRHLAYSYDPYHSGQGHYDLRSHGHGVPWPQQHPNDSRHPRAHPRPQPPPLSRAPQPLRTPRYSPPRSTRLTSRPPSPVRLPPINSNHPVRPDPATASSSRSSLNDANSQAGSGKLSEESPVTTPGGTKGTNRMGLGHLMD